MFASCETTDPSTSSQLTNSAAQVASGDILLLLNNDTVVLHPQWLTEMASLASRPEIGVVGARLLYPDRRIQHAGITFGPGKTIVHQMRLAGETEAGPGAELALLRSVSAVTGACLALRRDLYLEVGGMNEADFACSCNDIDLCRRVASSRPSIVCTPFAELMHFKISIERLFHQPRRRLIAKRANSYFLVSQHRTLRKLGSLPQSTNRIQTALYGFCETAAATSLS